MEISPLSPIAAVASHAATTPLQQLAALAADAAAAPASGATGQHSGLATSPLLAGLSSPLAAAGLLPTDAADAALLRTRPADAAMTLTRDAALPGSPAAGEVGRLTPPSPAAVEPRVAQPMTPGWITALQTPALRLGPWPDPQAPVRQREQRRRQQAANAEGAAVDDDSPAPADSEARPWQPLHDEHTTADDTDSESPSPAWPATTLAALPPEVQAELARRRAVLLVAPPVPGQRGLQLSCLSFGARGEPRRRHWAVRGAPAPTLERLPPSARPWGLWRVRREGDDGQRPLLHTRALAGGTAAAAFGPLLLRISATVLPPPLRAADDAWLDVLEPQRLWRELGTQWTVLLAWAPHTLRWDGT